MDVTTITLAQLMFGLVGTILTSTMGSAGLWAFLQRRTEKKSGTSRLLMGLAHREIINDGVRFIQRGSISRAEYQDYHTYLVEPYEKMGGNGMAHKVVQEVERLPLVDGVQHPATGRTTVGTKLSHE